MQSAPGPATCQRATCRGRNTLVPDPGSTRTRDEMRRVATVTNVFATSHRDNGPAGEADHEQVIFCQDTRTGLRAIIGIYSTALGPGLGGTRFYPYASEGEALTDVLRL